MGEVHYMISEAAKRVCVETHVLRYWEEELDLTIGRTEMGHRYYTDDDIQLFCCIRELKEQGLPLKDLKNVIPDMLQIKAQRKQQISAVPESPSEPVSELSELQKALQENNKLLESSISQAVSHAVITEMDFLLQAKERHEEERYKKLDALIRQQQAQRKESARLSPMHNFRRLFQT